MRYEVARVTGILTLAAASAALCVKTAGADQVIADWESDCSSGKGFWTEDCWGAQEMPNNGNFGDTYWAVISDGIAIVHLNLEITLDRLSVFPFNTLIMDDGHDFNIVGAAGNTSTGFVDVEGTLRLDSTGSNTDLRIDGGDELVLLSTNGNGLIEMTRNNANRIFDWTSGGRLLRIEEGLRIWGGGQIGLNGTAIENHGEIRALYADVPLIIDPVDTQVVLNSGEMEGDSGGTLRLNQGTYEAIDGGAFIAHAESLVELNACTIQHSPLNGPPLGEFRVTGDTTTLWNVSIGDPGLTVPNGRSPRLQDGIVNNGVSGISLESTGNTARLFIDNVDSDGVQLTGGGTVHMSDNVQNRIQGWDGGEHLVTDNLIRGSGQVGLNNISMQNEATIQADQMSMLTIDPNANGLVNRGFLKAIDGGTLRLNGGLYDQTQGGISGFGQIESQFDSLVELNACHILGGTLVSSAPDPGVFRVIGNTTVFQDVRFPSSHSLLEIPNGMSPRFIDDIENTGTFSIESTGNVSRMYIDNERTGGVTLSGGGEIHLGDHIQNRIQGWDGDETLTNNNVLIRGAGQLGLNSLGFITQGNGVFSADLTERMQIDPSSLGFANSGVLEARNGGTLRLQNGTFDTTNGTIQCLDGSTLEFYSADVDFGGGTLVLSGPCTVNCDSAYVLTDVICQSDPATQWFMSNGVGQLNDVSFDAEMTLLNNASIRLVDGIHNTGDIHLASTGNTTRLYIDNADTDGVQLTGGGTIHLGDHPQNRFQSWDGGEVLTNVDNLIRGSGQIGFNSFEITNQADGRIVADQPTKLTLDPNSTDMINDGVLRAENGGTLELSAAGVYQNANGRIEVGADSTVELLAPHIKGGLLVADDVVSVGDAAPGVFEVTGDTTTLEDLELDATLRIPNSRQIRVIDGMINRQIVSVESTANTTRIYVDEVGGKSVVLTGGGEIILGDHAQNRIQGWNGGELLHNADHTIRGGGQVGFNGMGVFNEGAIIADAVNDLVINVDDGGFENAGSVIVESGSTMTIHDTLSQTSGQTIVNGTLAFIAPGYLDLGGGVLSGIGTIEGDVVNEGGEVQVGASTGELTIDDGAYTQMPDGSFELEIGGPTPGVDHDLLTVAHEVSLGGTLRVAFLDEFTPSVGSMYTFMTADDVIGQFDEVTGPGQFSVIYGAQDVTLVVDSVNKTCAEDLNGDGTVDTIDLLIMLGEWGTDDTAADLNDDGTVDTIDLLILLGAWGRC